MTRSRDSRRRLVGGELRCGCFVAVLAEPAGDRVERRVSGDQVDHEVLTSVCRRLKPLTVDREEHLRHEPREPLVPVDQALVVVDRLAQCGRFVPDRVVRIAAKHGGLGPRERTRQQAGVTDNEPQSLDLTKNVLELEVAGHLLLREAVEKLGVLDDRAIEQFIKHRGSTVGCDPSTDGQHRDLMHRPVLPRRLLAQGLGLIGTQPHNEGHIKMIS